ncbi:MAG TPA: protein kinase [Gemmatimonadales bacterium]|nr:protein kinase [Gemmatimonadales bacterium]
MTDLEALRELLADRYRVEHELGRGGMATVYLAHDLRHDRDVALKVLRPELAAALGAERFLREITLTARLDHPHILPLLDSGEAGGFLYYVMPYVRGESLRDRLNRERQLPLEDALHIVRETADALSHAHSLEIIHRDVKPENILLTGSHARLADFGIARAVTAAGGQSFTATGLALGTPVYMSPEQAAGEGEVDARTDVYSLGCVLYEMLVGQPPFTGATAEAILARKYLDTPGGITSVRATVSREVEAVILKALARVPADRYSTARHFAQALERVREPPLAPPPATQRFPTRRIVLASVGVVLALAAAWWGGIRRPLAAPPLGSLAVLPFANVSGDPEQDYFANGMTEELISRLAGLPGLTVKSRTSVRRYQESDDPLPRIAEILGVDAVVEGSLSRSADAVRIRVRLVQARPERTLWSRSYDRDLSDALALQSEVARAIAREIGAVITPEHEQRLVRVAAIDPVAAEAYFRGRFYWNRRTSNDLLQAIRHFEQAIAVDPTYARAYAGLADSYVLLGYGMMSVLPPSEALPKASAAARQALELQDDLVEAQTSLAYTETYEWNWEMAELGFRRALALDPGYGTAHFWYAALLAAQGRVPEAVDAARQGWDVEPLSPILAAGVAWMLHLARRHEEAADQAQRALVLEPGFALGHLRLGVAYGWLDRHDDAIAQLELGLRASGSSPAFVAALVRVYAASGREREAQHQLAGLLDMAKQRYVPAYSIAAAHAALGDTDGAFLWLERAFEEHSLELTFIGVEPEMDILRADPRFRDLLRRMNLPT